MPARDFAIAIAEIRIAMFADAFRAGYR